VKDVANIRRETRKAIDRRSTAVLKGFLFKFFKENDKNINLDVICNLIEEKRASQVMTLMPALSVNYV
jgi:hypothetical protein